MSQDPNAKKQTSPSKAKVPPKGKGKDKEQGLISQFTSTVKAQIQKQKGYVQNKWFMFQNKIFEAYPNLFEFLIYVGALAIAIQRLVTIFPSVEFYVEAGLVIFVQLIHGYYNLSTYWNDDLQQIGTKKDDRRDFRRFARFFNQAEEDLKEVITLKREQRDKIQNNLKQIRTFIKQQNSKKEVDQSKQADLIKAETLTSSAKITQQYARKIRRKQREHRHKRISKVSSFLADKVEKIETFFENLFDKIKGVKIEEEEEVQKPVANPEPQGQEEKKSNAKPKTPPKSANQSPRTEQQPDQGGKEDSKTAPAQPQGYIARLTATIKQFFKDFPNKIKQAILTTLEFIFKFFGFLVCLDLTSMYWFGYFETQSSQDSDTYQDGDGTASESDDDSKEISSSERTLNHNILALQYLIPLLSFFVFLPQLYALLTIHIDSLDLFDKLSIGVLLLGFMIGLFRMQGYVWLDYASPSEMSSMIQWFVFRSCEFLAKTILMWQFFTFCLSNDYWASFGVYAGLQFVVGLAIIFIFEDDHIKNKSFMYWIIQYFFATIIGRFIYFPYNEFFSYQTSKLYRFYGARKNRIQWMEQYLQFGDFQKIEKAKGFDHTFTFTIQTLRVLEILNLALFLFAHGTQFSIPMYIIIGGSTYAYIIGVLKFSLESKVPTDL